MLTRFPSDSPPRFRPASVTVQTLPGYWLPPFAPLRVARNYTVRVGVRIEKVELPGIGVRHDLVTESGRRISVVSHRDGERDLALFDVADPDACRDSIPMTDDEAAALADVLGTSVMLSRLTNLSDAAVGLFTEQLELPTDSPYLNRPLGDTKTRTRTRVSIVAIVRDKVVLPSPTPDEILRPGDVIVAVGTRQGLDAVSRLISNGPD